MTGIIILAAGESRRLGTPKQLLPWRGQTLLRYTANVAVEANLGPVTVVLGAKGRECAEALEHLPVRLSYNPEWRKGMGGSIANGMASFADDDIAAVIVMLCDQPFVDALTLRALASKWRRGRKQIVACKQGGGFGAPVLFSAKRFDLLLGLEGPEGAQGLIRDDPSVSLLDCRGASVDINTPEDWARIADSVN